MAPPKYVRNIDPEALIEEKRRKSNFSAFNNHLKNPRSKKSKNLDKTAENFAKDPSIRAKDFKRDFTSDEGVQLQIGFGPYVDNYYERMNLLKIDPSILPDKGEAIWTDQKMFIKIKKKKRQELFSSGLKGRRMVFNWNRDPRVKMSCKIKDLLIFPKRATGTVTLTDVNTVRTKN